MTKELSSYSGTSSIKIKRQVVLVPCFNCFKKVAVVLPFYGCIFCSDCQETEYNYSADAPEFKRGIRFE